MKLEPILIPPPLQKVTQQQHRRKTSKQKNVPAFKFQRHNYKRTARTFLNGKLANLSWWKFVFWVSSENCVELFIVCAAASRWKFIFEKLNPISLLPWLNYLPYSTSSSPHFSSFSSYSLMMKPRELKNFSAEPVISFHREEVRV